MDRLREGARALMHPTGPVPRPTPRSRVFDAVLALVVGLASAYYVMDNLHGWADRQPVAAPIGYPARSADWIMLLSLAFMASGPLALRRRYPLAVLWIVMGATLLTPPDAARLTFYACIIAAYSAAAYSPYRVPTLASLPVAVLLVSMARDTVSPTVPHQYVPLLISVPIVVAANGLRTWKLRADEGRTRLSALEREQAEALRRAIEQERARIARELHDVVTHNVSVMVIQAGAARKVMEVAPDQAREALLAVEAGGRAAMGELRHVMGLLTMDADGSDPDGSVDLAPQPGLDQLDALVGRVRDTGVPVELTVSGQPRPVSAGVQLTAYRVVQEALTNAVKHAAGASATVQVDYGANQLQVEVSNTSGSPSASAATGNGRGLIGLRERLAVYGGTLRTGPRPLGGYRVQAQIPLEEA
ncbi:sensor histidine kinase [Streptomyces sp. ISL-98]|uniref:sensor histidine kinase n=1 Tax=Streptomyces sp. ISL-98 TaxID=2819192 RepID=UPI00203652DF|nr:histidine kinase [Streptomyces sp. ISL-98]